MAAFAEVITAEQQFECWAARVSIPSNGSLLGWDTGYWDTSELWDLVWALSTDCQRATWRDKLELSEGNFIN